MKARLNQKLITTAWELTQADDTLIKKLMSVVGLRTAYELRGVPCLSLEEMPQPKKSLTTCRGFGAEISDFEELTQAVASYTARLAAKLRRQKKVASTITVFAFPTLDYNYSLSMVLTQPTAYTPLLIHLAKTLFSRLYREGTSYRKVGILLDGLIPEGAIQLDLFAPATNGKQKNLMAAVDCLNQRKKTIRFAAEGLSEPWKMKQGNRSPRYTTNFDELLLITM